MKKIKIAVLPGDGIGSDVMQAALPIFQVLNIPVELVFGSIGWECWMREGNSVPQETWKLIASCDVTLLGATTSKPEREAIADLPKALQKAPPKYISPIIQLRQKLDLFANIRPCFNVKSQGNNFNFAVIRENTEGLYAGLDYYPLGNRLKSIINENARWRQITNNNAACSLRLQTTHGLSRLFKFAFNYAAEKNFSKVTFADKPNVLRKSGAFARSIFEEVANQYPHITSEIHNVDAVGLWLIRRPQDFGIIVAENMFGDILSDVGAGMMGGLGFAPSANIGNNGCYFEPVHGSAPRVKQNTANPSAMFLTIALLLEKFGYDKQSSRIKKAVEEVVKLSRHVTYDLGGHASTEEMAADIIERCLRPTQFKRVSFLATGNEIVYGEVQDTNTSSFAKEILEQGGCIYQRMSVSDNQVEIASALNYLLDSSEAVVVTGGLGPTTDDTTRFAVADVTKSKLYVNEEAWSHVVNRLTQYELPINESNQQQALFPAGSEIYINELGTACGARVEWNQKQIFMLPGPPRECKNMFNKNVINKLKQDDFLYKTKTHKWLTLGVIEGEISPIIDKISKLYSVDIAYKWIYPYLEIRLSSNRNEAVDELIFKIDNLLAEYLISKNDKDAFEVLAESAKKLQNKLFIVDAIESHVVEINQYNNIEFINKAEISSKYNQLFFSTSQPKIYQTEYIGKRSFDCLGYINETLVLKHSTSTPNRGLETKEFINAYMAWQISKFIELLGK